MVLPAILARGRGCTGAAALARSAHLAGRRVAHEGGPDQHGAFTRGAAAAARSSLGGVHAERRSGAPRRSPPPPRQAAGAPPHAAAAPARSPGTPQVRIWITRASLAQVPAARAASGGCATSRARGVGALGGPRVSPRVVAVGARPMVRGLWLS